jgi:hypothetical protein
MNRLRRAFLVLAISLVATALALVFRGLIARGAFVDASHRFSGVCSSLAGSAEDFEWDGAHDLLFASVPVAVGDRQAGLYVISPDHLEKGFVRLGGAPANFHPAGIGLFQGSDGRLVLMAVDRPVGQDPAVEIFDLKLGAGTVSLIQRASVTGGLLSDPVDVVPVGPDQFYVTNRDSSATTMGRVLADFGIVPRGNVVFFDGNFFRVAADGLNGAGGIRASGDGTHLYVASPGARTLYAFARDPFSGSLSGAAGLTVGPGLGEVGAGDKGGLLITAQPRPFRPSGRLASQVFRVSLANGVPEDSALAYSDPGSEIDGATSAVSVNGSIFIGSPHSPKILICRER